MIEYNIPVFASISPIASACTSFCFSARDVGFILKLPPTKNLRAIFLAFLWDNGQGDSSASLMIADVGDREQ